MPKGIPNRTYQIICQWCGEDFQATRGYAKYCDSKCKESARYQKDHDKRITYQREYNRKNSAIQNEKRRLDRKNNKEKYSEQNRIRYLRDREVILKRNKEYQKSHPHVSDKTRYKRKAVESFEVSVKDYNRLLIRYRNKCAYCNIALDDWGRLKANSLQWDHVVPLSRGGRHSIGNLVPCCRSCNISKRDKFVVEWKLRRLKARND